MPTSRPIQRGSWGLEIAQPLYCPPGSTHLALRQSQSPTLVPDDVHLRVDWQTLRRLPLSGAIVFNFKALFTPLAELRDEAGVPGLLLHVLRHGKEEIMKYKDTWHVEHVVRPLLEEWEREQWRDGVFGGEEGEGGVEVEAVGDEGGIQGKEGREMKRIMVKEEGWEPKTLDESPYFRGWEEKWHRQQGF